MQIINQNEWILFTVETWLPNSHQIKRPLSDLTSTANI